MKSPIRTIVFTLISLRAAQYVIGALDFGEGYETFLLVSLALGALFFFIKPVLSLVGLPTGGLGFLFLNFILTFVIFYVLTLFLDNFSVQETTLSDLNIFGFVLPSKELTTLWAAVFSALVVSIVYTFFDWLCSNKR